MDSMRFFQTLERMKTKTRCILCPKGCNLNPGETGNCNVRQNLDGQIVCITYNKPCSMNIDPIEKKPLYHVLPGSNIFSVGTAGCNQHCKQCQNWQISQASPISGQTFEALEITSTAIKEKCPAIAYTYAEPLVSYEYTLECCRRAAERGIKNILVTGAYFNPEPLRKICRFIDAANVDLKSFSDDFYRDVCDARLKPVLKALTVMKQCGVFIEITNLLIPTLNDSDEEIKKLCSWVIEHLGEQTPIHFSRFFPQYKLKHLPPTPIETIQRARSIAMDAGLQFVYVGNMADRVGESTFCPACGSLIVERSGYQVYQNRIKDGSCPDCFKAIPGIWK